MKTPKLTAKRITLTPSSAVYADEIFNEWTSDPRVARYMRWNPHKSAAETEEWLKMEESAADSEHSYQWIFCSNETDELIGSGGLIWDEEANLFEVGYNVKFSKWNQGYATEALKTMIAFAKEELNQPALLGRHATENPASGAVMKKCGFVFCGKGSAAKFDGTETFATDLYRLELGKK